MKFLKKLLGLLLLLSTLLMALLFACAWKPGLTEKIGAFLYPEAGLQQEDMAGSDDAESSSGNSAAKESGSTGNSAAEESGSMAGDDADAATGIAEENGGAAGYIAPDAADISVPEEVAGKGGYQPLQQTDSQLEEPEAEALKEQIGTGETGDGLTFDPLFYPYYAMLDEKGQHLYRQIYANAMARNPSFAPVEPVTAKALEPVLSAVYNDHPELFWLDTAYGCKCRENGQCVALELQFNRTAKNLEGENAAFERAAGEILEKAEGLGNDYDKERYVHDALLDAVEYSRSAEMNQSAYSALVGGRTVCAGYARAFQYLMQKLGIPCYYCTGFAGEDHAWNIIRLEDGFYNADVTWDDTGDGTYDYFNKNDQDYSDTHVRQELSVNLPPCSGEKYRTANQADENGRRSSLDAGYSEKDILHSMAEYYDDCYRQVLENGRGSYSFANVIEGEALYQEWEKEYETQAYKEAYMVEAMRGIGAKSCHLTLRTEPLQDERYLLTHELELE